MASARYNKFSRQVGDCSQDHDNIVMDTLGNAYVQLAQANSNSLMMELYFRALVDQLDKERVNWRRDTVIFVDGAKYHQSKDFLQIAAELRLPYMLLGPHSYDAAPCELFFAHFKRDDINPRHVPTAKSQFNKTSKLIFVLFRHFQTIVELCMKRIYTIPQSHFILYWHNCLEYVYRYLLLHRL